MNHIVSSLQFSFAFVNNTLGSRDYLNAVFLDKFFWSNKIKKDSPTPQLNIT